MDIVEKSGVKLSKNVRDADVLTQYAVQSRYPSIVEEITWSEYRDALKLAAGVVFWAEKIIKQEIRRYVELLINPLCPCVFFTFQEVLMIRIISIISLILLLAACAAPPNPPLSAEEGLGVRETPPPTFTPTAFPTETPTPTPEPTASPEPTLDPNAWQEFGNVVVQNKNLAPYDKQLIINPELEAQTAETIFTICNQYSYIVAMASEFNKTRSDSALPQSKYKSFDNFMKQVIQPAIDGGKTIQGWHLVGHETYSNKQPYEGMVEPLPDFDPSVCSIKIGGNDKIYANSPIISVGSFQIGMNVINKDGKPIRELIVNTSKTLRNGYGFYFTNSKMSDKELATSFSQMLYTAEQEMNNLVVAIPTSSSTRNEFLYAESKNDKIGFSFALPGTAGVDLVSQWMSEAPNYFIPPTP